jgi:hypothetical protein
LGWFINERDRLMSDMTRPSAIRELSELNHAYSLAQTRLPAWPIPVGQIRFLFAAASLTVGSQPFLEPILRSSSG